ncbi:MAG: hypothetical protein K2L21_02535, partial [Muribaculaceae bacterium]|nr:hypothetical protein [Muribaculaceae bacterium]
DQILAELLTNFIIQSLFRPLSGNRRHSSSEKRVQNYNIFTFLPNNFAIIFQENCIRHDYQHFINPLGKHTNARTLARAHSQP